MVSRFGGPHTAPGDHAHSTSSAAFEPLLHTGVREDLARAQAQHAEEEEDANHLNRELGTDHLSEMGPLGGL